MNLLKEHQVGDWCKRAAWFFAAIGVINIVLNIYSVMQQLASFPSGSVTGAVVFVQMLGAVVSAITNPIFYFFILYAAGTVVNRFIGYIEDNETNGKASDATLAWREETGIKPITTDTVAKTGNVAQDKVEDTTTSSTMTDTSQQVSDVTLAKVGDTATESSTAEPDVEGSDVTLAKVGDTATESSTAEPDVEGSDMRVAKVGDTATESSAVESNGKKSGVTSPRRKSRR